MSPGFFGLAVTEGYVPFTINPLNSAVVFNRKEIMSKQVVGDLRLWSTQLITGAILASAEKKHVKMSPGLAHEIAALQVKQGSCPGAVLVAGHRVKFSNPKPWVKIAEKLAAEQPNKMLPSMKTLIAIGV
jgi:hypothetical protein